MSELRPFFTKRLDLLGTLKLGAIVGSNLTLLNFKDKFGDFTFPRNVMH
jgi:hypothetical protein